MVHFLFCDCEGVNLSVPGDGGDVGGFDGEEGNRVVGGERVREDCFGEQPG